MKELAPNTYTFAEYELDLTRRLFLRGGQSVPLNAKTFDLLVVLIENRERVIAKEELMDLGKVIRRSVSGIHERHDDEGNHPHRKLQVGESSMTSNAVRTASGPGSPSGQPAWGGGSDRV